MLYLGLAQSLLAHGIDILFGVMGDGNFDLIAIFSRLPRTRFVAATNQSSAVMMAIGLASASGKTTAATVTYGPGVSNCTTALIEGVRSRLPIVLIVGGTEIRDTIIRKAQRDLITATGAGLEEIRSPSTAMQSIAKAFRRARTELRPIVLQIPSHLLTLPLHDSPIVLPIPGDRSVAPLVSDVDKAVDVIVASKRPIVVAGHDAAHARTELVDLARRSGSLLATTCRAKDLFVGEKEYLGLFGLTSSEEAICLMMESDCIMFFGASVEMHENPDQILAKAKSVFWFDRHSKSFNPRRERKLAFNGDPALAADHLREHLDARNIPPRKYPSDQRLPVRAFAAPYKAKSYALFHEFLLAAEKIVPANRILVTDASRYSSAAQRILSVQNPNLHLQSWARGSVGAGVPTALGAAFADLKKTVLLITTVSGFMSEGIADFQTAVRNSIDLIVVLCNDGESGSDFERYSKARFEKDLMHYQLPDFVEVAASLGGTGHNIKSTDALGALPAIIAKRNRPILLNLDLQDRSSHRLSEPYPMSVSGHHRLQLVADRH